MNLIGLNDFSHDVTAALVVNGEVVLAGEEERFSRKKHHHGFIRGGGPPDRALAWCLSAAGLRGLRDIDAVVLSWAEMGPCRWFLARHAALQCYRRADVKHLPATAVQVGNTELLTEVIARYKCRRRFLRRLSSQVPLVEVPHHLSHASYAYRTSPFDEAAIFVLDAAGENASTSVYHACGNKLRELVRFPISQSLGILYGMVTRFLGLGRDAEGKTMALASYGQPLKLSFVTYDRRKDKFFLFYNRLAELRRFQRSVSDPIEEIHADIAATLQRDVQNALEAFIDSYVQKTGTSAVCIGGGVGLNCTANGRLISGGNISRLYVPAAPNDCGTAVGAALEHESKFNDCFQMSWRHSFLGMRSSLEEMKDSLTRYGSLYQVLGCDAINQIANDVLGGRVVGVFRGSAEFGPRALGNRSILADPSISGVKDRINIRVKGREPWRPLAVMVLEEDTLALFGKSVCTPFMNVALPATPTARRFMPDIIHRDRTVRIQTIANDISNIYCRILMDVKSARGIGVMINTSFNGRLEPIVNTPEEALRTFYETEMDILYFGDFFRVWK